MTMTVTTLTHTHGKKIKINIGACDVIVELGSRVSGIVKNQLDDKEVNGGVSGAPSGLCQSVKRTDEWIEA